MKRLHPRHILRLYRMNRLWGDNMLEALYWALRGKAFTASFQGRLVEHQITQRDIEDEWWRAIR